MVLRRRHNGKFKFKIRKTNFEQKNCKNNKDNINFNIEKISQKLSKNFNVKLKKYDEANERKTTEVTKKYGPEEIKNHLQNQDEMNKSNKK